MIRYITICVKGEFGPPVMEHKIHAQAIAQDQFSTKTIHAF